MRFYHVILPTNGKARPLKPPPKKRHQKNNNLWSLLQNTNVINIIEKNLDKVNSTKVLY